MMLDRYKYIDDSVNPTKDFYAFATGKWIDYHPQPKEYPSWNVFGYLNENLISDLYELIKNIKGTSKIRKKMKMFYKKYSDYETRNNIDGVEPLKRIIKKINNFKDKESLLKWYVSEYDNICFMSVWLGIDDMDSDSRIVYLYQSLLLGTKEEYLSDNPKVVELREKFKDTLVNLYKYLGTAEKIAREKVEQFFKFEYELIDDAYSVEDLTKPELMYHKVNIDDVSSEFDMRKIINYMGFDKTEDVVVGQVEYIKKAAAIIQRLTLRELKDIFILYRIINSAGRLSDEFYDIYFDYVKFSTGVEEKEPKWKKEVGVMDYLFSEEIGKIYISKYFNKEDKDDVIRMIKNIIDSYSDIIEEQTWMSEQTKRIALDKLHSMTYKIGYQEKWDDYSDMPVDENLCYYDNIYEIKKWLKQKALKKYYNKPVDKSEWPWCPQTINACYMPNMNEICFPAGILQAPFYDRNAPLAVNYGSIGVIIGHEITHGFDAAGRQFTKDGLLKDWWTEEDANKFKELTINTKVHFDNIKVIDDMNCNGEFTLNENIADYGGLKIAYNALKKEMKRKEKEKSFFNRIKDLFKKEKYNWKQQFFIAYAQSWAGVDTEEIMRQKILHDCHSVKNVRVNGTLPMFDEWYDAWNVKKTDDLYVNKEDRAKIW